MIRCAADRLEKTLPPRTVGFGTVTVPSGLGESEQRLLAGYWPELNRQFHQWLGRRLSRSGVSQLVVSVSEVQSQRYLNFGQFPLHLHFVYQCRKNSYSPFVLSPLEVREYFCKLVSRFIGRPCHSTAVENLQVIKKSASGYIGKYLSKGGEIVSQMADTGDDWMLPRQWWYVSRPLASWVRRNTARGMNTGKFLEALCRELLDADEWPDGYWAKPILIDLDGFSYLAGWVGRIPVRLARDWINCVQSH
jgi:hypothetical protein